MNKIIYIFAICGFISFVIDVFCMLPKVINKILDFFDKIHKKQQHDDAEKFYCNFRGREVTYRKTCNNCIIASVDEDGYFFCSEYYMRHKDLLYKK